jgi:acyl carrier protein
LLEAFQLSVDLRDAPDSLPTEVLWQQVRRNIGQEEELAADPAFFSAIRRRLSRISHAATLLKRGSAQNELTRFRYDAILYTDAPEPTAVSPTRIDWGREKLTLAAVRERLLDEAPAALAIAGVPNARVLPEARAAASLARGDGPERAGDLRRAIEDMRASALHPELFWALSDELPYSVEITWSAQYGPEFFDVSCQRRDLKGSRRPHPGLAPAEPVATDWRSYAHNPIEAKLNRALRPSLRSFVEKTLPPSMIPAAFVVLDALPLSANGKLDRRALPKPDAARPGLEFVAPRTAVEQTLANIWSEVLGLERVGVYDDFFVLGGHSLIATQIASRVHDAFDVELPLRILFEGPTIAALSEFIARTTAAARGVLDGQSPESVNGELSAALSPELQLMSDQQPQPSGPKNV